MQPGGSRGFTIVLALFTLLAASATTATAAPAVPEDLDTPLTPTSTPAPSEAPDTSPVDGTTGAAGDTAQETGARGASIVAALGDAAGAVAAGLGAVAGGAAAAAGAVLDGLGALVGAIAAALGALVGGLAWALGALFSGLLWLLGGLAWTLGALVGGLAWALGGSAGGLAWAIGALASCLAWGIGALAGALLALGSLVATALVGAGTWAYHHPETAAPIGGTAVAAGTVGWLTRAGKLARLAPLLGVPLFSRLADHDLLNNKTRKGIYAFIQRHPGAHISQINQEMGIGWGTTVYHLNRLRDARLVTVRKAGNQLCHFVNGQAGSAEEQRRVTATKTAKAQAIVQFLTARGPSTQHRIAEHLGMSSALVSWHAKRLEDHGIVDRVRNGRTSTLVLREVAASAPASVASASAAPAQSAPARATTAVAPRTAASASAAAPPRTPRVVHGSGAARAAAAREADATRGQGVAATA